MELHVCSCCSDRTDLRPRSLLRNYRHAVWPDDFCVTFLHSETAVPLVPLPSVLACHLATLRVLPTLPIPTDWHVVDAHAARANLHFFVVCHLVATSTFTFNDDHYEYLSKEFRTSKLTRNTTESNLVDQNPKLTRNTTILHCDAILQKLNLVSNTTKPVSTNCASKVANLGPTHRVLQKIYFQQLIHVLLKIKLS